MRAKKGSKRKWIIQIMLLLLGVLSLTGLTIKVAPQVSGILRQPDQFKTVIDSYGQMSALVFIAFQVIQVVISVIPGDVVQIAGGYIYGTFWGTVYSAAGILIGTVAAFYGARLLGSGAVRFFVSEKSMQRLHQMMDAPRSEFVLFLFFLIPGLPKDILVYAAGLSPIRSARFFSLFTVARLPGLVGSSVIGANLQQENYPFVIILLSICCLLFGTGFVCRRRIMAFIKSMGASNTHRREGK